ncbi:hypothetical protein NBH00_17740 [Paraconexibacter antarcticus]|uniref:Gluconate 2-dehydrogenase subunit 3 family protein n=1 Tax=Paraconexibacter antarcticus TaxID=2949664 RepID=A0ABY5DQL4_9ACTN|nr:hypothetical protein [Paraconexibacter antarcticus]UTI63196.1 hypothetical protein NBH00_17740 [Paraconexibacter antarcticus]
MTTPPFTVLRPREASIFAAFVEAVVAPEPPLPPVRETGAALALDASLAAAPAANRLVLRQGLYALELAPLVLGHRARLRRLDPAARREVLARAEAGPLGPLVQALRTLAHLGYYGDDAVMRGCGYDAGAVVARGAHLRVTEARW